jgi:transcriptional regulator with XRE-family HTH domain
MSPRDDLKLWLTAHDITQADFARRIGYDRSNLNAILAGNLWPTLELAFKIERETNGDVPMSSWAEAKAA